jgi:hypothetical protein
MRVMIIGIGAASVMAAVGLARAQDATLTPELMDVDPVALEIPADRGADAVKIEVDPDGSGGRMAADASDPGGVWAWITGNPGKSAVIAAGTTYLTVQGTRGKLGSDMRGLGRAVGLLEHDEPTDAQDAPQEGGAAGGDVVAPPGGNAVNVTASDNARVTVIIGDGNGLPPPEPEAAP